MIELEERIRRYADRLTDDVPSVSVDEVLAGPATGRAGAQPARLLMMAAVTVLAVAGGIAVIATRDSGDPTTMLESPASTAVTTPPTEPAPVSPPPTTAPIVHERFQEYLAATIAVLGPVEIGASCADVPDLTLAQFEQLVVLPVMTGDPDCRVVGWTYRLPMGGTGLELPAEVTGDGRYQRGRIYDEVGNVIGTIDE